MGVPVQPATNLANVALTATAGASGDSVAISVGRTIYRVGTSNVLNLFQNWNQAEFNIFGDGNSSQYSFNGGTSIVVQLLTDTQMQGTRANLSTAPGTTGETNNLTIVPRSFCAFGGNPPGIQFMESNASAPTVPACPLMPIDPNSNWTLVDHPFDAIVAGTDVDGTPLLPCRAAYAGGLHPGKTRADWTYCSITFGGREYDVQPYESLVAGWIDGRAGSMPGNALAFGSDGYPGPTLYPCRAYLDGNGLQLGKFRPGLGVCEIPFGNQERQAVNYQVLTTNLPLTTASVNSAHPPAGALVGGYDSGGQPLYVCQALYNGGLVPGKVQANGTSCDVSWGGREHYVSSYTVLLPYFEAAGLFFQAGYESSGAPLGVCRGSYRDLANRTSIQVGKFLTTGSCNVSDHGLEEQLNSGYQVLSY